MGDGFLVRGDGTSISAAWIWARMERLSSSPGELVRLMGYIGDQDISALLGELRVPTLILHRTGDRLIDVLLRAPANERGTLESLAELSVPTSNGRTVPLAQVATIGEAVVVRNADHGMDIPGDPILSVRAVERVVEAAKTRGYID